MGLTQTEALEAIGGLSAPAKMPCLSWSIPADTCPLGSLLRNREGSTCANCYALKGMYVMPNVRTAMERRYAILAAALTDGRKADAFVSAFAAVLNAKAEQTRKRIARGQVVRRDGRVFRWHDSGDLLSVEHLGLLVEIAARTPEVGHWLPTREAGTVKRYLDAVGRYGLPGNLQVRISTPLIDRAPAPALWGLAEHPQVTLSGVHSSKLGAEADACIAYTQGGECRDCRACWDPSRALISYPLH